MQTVSQRNEWVRKWLKNSNKIETKGAKLHQTAGVLAIASSDCGVRRKVNSVKEAVSKQVGSQYSSEVSFKPMRPLCREPFENPNDINSSSMQDQDIPLGASAMSGTSSITRRRIKNNDKFDMLNMLHATECNETELNQPSRTEHDSQLDRGHLWHDHDNARENQNWGDEEIAHSQGSESEHDQQTNVQEHTLSNEEAINSQQQQQSIENNSQPKYEEDSIPVNEIDLFRNRLKQNDQTVFYDMFEMIITKLSVMQNNIKHVKFEQDKVKDRLTGVERYLDVCTQSIDEIDEEMDDVRGLQNKLIECVIKNEKNVNSLQKNIEQVADRMNKGCFIVNGMQVFKDKTVKESVESFLQNIMHLNPVPEIASAHRMGGARSAPVWFRLADPDETAIIFKNASKLKGLENPYGKKYLIREYTTEKKRDQQVRNHDLVMENRRLPISHKLELAYDKGQLLLNGERIGNAINTPQVKDALLLKKEDEAELDAIPIHSTPKQIHNGSIFQAFAIQAKDFDKIQMAYVALNNQHLSASHLACAYRVFGSSFPHLQNYVDGGEYGAGRKMLQVLKDLKVWNIAVYIVRYHNGPNLGPQRFEIIDNLIKEVVTSFPKALNYGQFFTDKTLLKNLNKAAEVPVKGDNPQKFGRIPRGGPGRPRGNRGRKDFKGRGGNRGGSRGRSTHGRRDSI